MKRLLTAAMISLALHSTARADEWNKWHEYKQFSYACFTPAKDAYGEVKDSWHCEAGVSAAGVGETLIVFYATLEKDMIFPHQGFRFDYESSEGCEDYPSPTKIAVDGRRIDEWSDEEELQAVLKGKSLIRQMVDEPWPECSLKDVTFDIHGAAEVYARLKKLRDSLPDSKRLVPHMD